MSTTDRVVAELKADPGLRALEISDRLGLGIKPVRNALERLQRSGRAYSVICAGQGRPARWYPGGYVIPQAAQPGAAKTVPAWEPWRPEERFSDLGPGRYPHTPQPEHQGRRCYGGR